MSNYIMGLSLSALELQCCGAITKYDRQVRVTFLLLDAVQDVVATLFDECRRVVSSSYHAVLRGRSAEIERVRNLKFKMLDELGRK
jgi:hypothetical protein